MSRNGVGVYRSHAAAMRAAHALASSTGVRARVRVVGRLCIVESY